MKKATRFIVLSTLVFLFTQVMSATTPPIPPEVKTHMLTFIAQMSKHCEVFFDASEKASTPEAMAQALDTYHQGVRPLIEGIMKLKAKYADFFAATEKENIKSSGDAELDKANEAFEKRMEKFGMSLGKAMQWLDHPKMKAALARMQETMSILDEGKEDPDDQEE